MSGELEDEELSIETQPVESIFYGNTGEPPECEAIAIAIDGTVKSNLDWKRAQETARLYAGKGKKIFWDFDLGLFDKLPKPLDNQSQFLSLTLSLEHFRDSLWKEFQECTAGISFYKGSADFPLDNGLLKEENFSDWIKQKAGEQGDEARVLYRKLFRRDACVEYLNLLAARMPDAMPLFLQIDASDIRQLELEALLLDRELFTRFYLAVKNSQLGGYPYRIDENIIRLNRASLPGIAICLPPADLCCYATLLALKEPMDWLFQQGKSFRVIPESLLITEWDGLDYLVFTPKALSSAGKRKLQGFCAAGGRCVTLGSKIGLPLEIDWNEFQEEMNDFAKRD